MAQISMWIWTLNIRPVINKTWTGFGRNIDLCIAGAVLYQLSYQANWELVMFWVHNSEE